MKALIADETGEVTGFVCPGCGPQPDAPGARRRRVLPVGFCVVTCPRCRVEWQWPRPSAADLRRLYSQAYYDAWGLQEDEAPVRTMKLRTFDRLLARLERQVRPAALLDVGCATGFLLEAAERRGWEPYGIELSDYGSAVAKRRFGEARILNTTLEQAPFPAGFFGAITMSDLIEHVLDPVGALRVAGRLLRPGGVLCISTPKVGSVSYYLMGRRWTQYKLEHLQYYSPEAINRLLSGLGFHVAECRSWPKTVTLDYVAFQFARYRHWLISPAVGALSAVLPRNVRALRFSIPLGDMLVVAVRQG
jgi:SAM-dependent methyltransferase